MVTKTCRWCGKEFESTHKKVFCSSKCKVSKTTNDRKIRREIREAQIHELIIENVMEFLEEGGFNWDNHGVEYIVENAEIIDHQIWSNKVKSRDGKCQVCGSTHNLEAHHIKPKNQNPELTHDVDNGMTLCEKCHRRSSYSVHHIIGVVYSSEQFAVWFETAKASN